MYNYALPIPSLKSLASFAKSGSEGGVYIIKLPILRSDRLLFFLLTTKVVNLDVINTPACLILHNNSNNLHTFIN